jgi:hypothetical protein
MGRRIELTESQRTELLTRPTLTKREAAALLRVGATNLTQAIESGALDLPVIEIGRRRVIPCAAVKSLLGMAK